MVNPVASRVAATAVRGSAATGVGPIGSVPQARRSARPNGANDNQLGGRQYATAPERHKDGALIQAADSITSKAGHGLFTASFMASIAGWLTRQTVGRVMGKEFTGKIGRATFAPAQALDKVSFAQLFPKGLSSFDATPLKGEYWKSAAQYAKDYGVGNAKYEANAAKYAHVPGRQTVKWSGFKHAGKWLAHKPVFSLVMATGLGAAALLAGIRASKGAKENYDDLAEVASDYTGTKISKWQLMNKPESLPKMVQEMIGNTRANVMPSAAAAAGEAIENAAFASMGGPAAHSAAGVAGAFMGLPMAGMMGGTMLSQAAEGFRPAQNFTQSYLAIKDLQATGQAVAPDYYAQLMAAASPEVRMAGGMESRQVQRLAEQYAAEGLSAKQVVKEIDTKQPFQKRAEAIAKDIEREDKLAKAAAPKPAHDGPIQTPATTLAKPEQPKTVAMQSSIQHDGKLQVAQQASVGAPA